MELDYLLDSKVFYLNPCLYPMKYLHPRSMYTLPRGGVQRGVHYKVADLTIEIMLGFFALEGNPLL